MTTTAQITLAWVQDRCILRDGCWLWQHSVAYNGLPRVSVKENGRSASVQIRRRVWELSHPGEPMDGRFVGCACADKRCVNPKHLTIRTKAEIVADTWRRPDTRVRRTKGGHTGGMHHAKLDMDKARYIRQSDKSQAELSRELGVTVTIISRVRCGLAWREAGNPFAGLLAANDNRQRNAA